MQLVAYGAQDIYLTGNPQITFFKVVYRRHTNFSMETIVQTLNGTASENSTSTCTISRNGDLVYRMYVTSTTAGTTDGSTTLVTEAELEIGGQKIDKHYSEWMNVWNELSTTESKAVGLKSMIGSIGSSGTSGVGLVQVPLQFWFCRNPGLALPLIALQYHEVKVKILWGSDSDTTCGINCDYIYLDTDERRRFAQVSHEYLIEQLQKEDKSESGTHKLNFNHPVKELIWTTAAGDDYVSANIKLNGHDRIALQETEYFQLRQPYECHTAVPRQNLPVSAQIGLSNNTISNLTALSDGGVMTPVDSAGASSNQITVAAPGTALKVETAVFGDISVGDTLVLVISALDASNDAFLPTASRAVGDVFFAGVSAKSGTQDVTLTTKFTKLGTSNTQLDTVDVGTGGQARCFLHKVSYTSQSSARTSSMVRKVNVYSFALKPEEHQPSGTCNFSRIDNAQLIFSTAKACIVYAVNYNVLRIMSGMGGLAYSN